MATKITPNVSVIITEDKYVGKYVALKNFNDFKVCGSGDTPDKAYEQGVKNGCDDPVIIFVPLKELTYLY